MDLLPGTTDLEPGGYGNSRQLYVYFSRHWLTVFYLAESFLILGGLLLRKPDLSTLGIGLLIPTLLLHFLTLWIGGFIQSKRKFARVMDIIKELPFFIIAAVLFILIYLGTRHFKADILEPLIDTFQKMWIASRE